MKNVYQRILLDPDEISDLVLATVAGTNGSTPQKAGSSALFNRSGLVYGTVGGGILEGKVQELSKEAYLTRSPGLFQFRLDNSKSGGEDALCGGSSEILIDPGLTDHLRVFEEIKSSIESRIPGILVTSVTRRGESGVGIKRYWVTGAKGPTLPPELFKKTGTEISEMLEKPITGDFRRIILERAGEGTISFACLEHVIPPKRLIIAGAGHIGKALSWIGQMLDFEVTVIDDRPEFANTANLVYADQVIADDIGKTISGIERAGDTYIVIVTRGHRDDASALRACINSDAGYIGMIGSSNKVASMQKEFLQNGWATREQWERIYAPVGLEIRSQTVEEIAVSIAAQLIQVRSGGKGD